jgi:hypothetical protein
MTDEQPQMPTKRQILEQNIAGREAEIMSYDINVESFEFQVADIETNYKEGDDLYDEMQKQKAMLTKRIADEKREREKSRLVLRAHQAQLAALPAE